MQAAIVAGGLGTRMGQSPARPPKPMIPVGGKPLLEHQLLWLKGQGFKTVTLCLGYKAETISAYFGDGARWGVSLRYQVEAAPRGTAGCIKDLAPEGDVLVVYGDLFPELDLAPFLAFHAGRPEAAASLVLLETDHPLDSDLARMDGERVAAIYRAEAGKPYDNLALAAVWAVRPALLPLIPAQRPSDFGRDIFPKALAQGLPVYGCPLRGALADLGTPERLAAFEGARRAA